MDPDPKIIERADRRGPEFFPAGQRHFAGLRAGSQFVRDEAERLRWSYRDEPRFAQLLVELFKVSRWRQRSLDCAKQDLPKAERDADARVNERTRRVHRN